MKPKVFISAIVGVFLLFSLSFAALSNKPKSSSSECQNLVGAKLCTEIGQMLIVGFGGFSQDQFGKITYNDQDGLIFKEHSAIAHAIAEQHIGGVILFTKAWRDTKTEKFIRDRNIQNPTQVAQLNSALQNYNSSIRAKQNLLPLPLFLSVDQEGGMIDRMPANLGFPLSTLLPEAFGAKEDVNLNNPQKKERALSETYAYAQNLAKEIKAAKFNLVFSPTVDVDVNATNPIIGGLGRSFSSNECVVADQAQQFIRAFRENGIIPVLKHFPGHGSSTCDTHVGLVDVTSTYQKTKELYPYQVLLKTDYVGMVMTTHVINGQVDKTQCKSGATFDHTTWCPGTMSYKTLTNLLRKQLHFNGLIVSDDMTMGAITKEYLLADTLQKAINAGVDIFIVANNHADQTAVVVDTIALLVKDGRVSRKKIDDAYARITQFKQTYMPL